MPSSQPLDESTILSRFLLQPSSLPTILPYKAFLNLLPANIRNDPDLHRTLRKVYNDLQFQRSIDIDNVRANIERECARSGTLKARLRKEIAREMDGSRDDEEALIVDMTSRATAEDSKTRKRTRDRLQDSPELEMSSKRRRSIARDSAAHESDSDKGDDPNHNTRQSKRSTRSTSRRASSPTKSNEEAASQTDPDSDTASSSSDQEIPESPTSTSSANLSPLSSSPPPSSSSSNSPKHDPDSLDALLDYTFHGPRGLALPSSYTAHQPQSLYHTRSSLLAAMESAVKALEVETAELDDEAGKIMGQMQETVGGLSDLRYGKFAQAREGEGGGGGNMQLQLQQGLEASVEEGLRGLCDVLASAGPVNTGS